MSTRTGKILGSRVGSVIDVVPHNNGEMMGKFLQVRVRLDVEQPLCQGTKLFQPNGDVELIEFRYEKLPKLCYGCSRIGHVLLECDVISESQKKQRDQPYGDFLKVEKRKKNS